MGRLGMIALGLALALAGCKEGTKAPSTDASARAVDELMAVDRAFNDMAREKGEQAAFVAYMDPEMGMQLRANQEPAKGRDQIKALHDDTSVPSPLVWEPAEAYAAKSGDFGMTWGHWHWSGDVGGAPATRTGKYLTVWHKTADGEWKGLMDTGVSDRAPESSMAPAPGLSTPSSLAPTTPPANLAPIAPPPANPSRTAPPDITPSTVPQDGEAPPPTPSPAPHSSPNNSQ